VSFASVKSALQEVRSQQQKLEEYPRTLIRQERKKDCLQPLKRIVHRISVQQISEKRGYQQWRLIQERLEEELERERLELERIARLWRSLEYLAILLLSTLRFLLSSSKFGGFQNRQRPRCTTMPWTIWPSLVVLWGVCWMFVNTPLTEFDADYFNSVFENEQLSPFVPGKTLPFT
jgi:hypothetical protein